MNANQPAVPAGEFRSIRRPMPGALMTALMLFTVLYGFCLTLTLPFNLADGLLDEGALGLFGMVGNVLFAGLLLMTMVRWCFFHPIAVLGFQRTMEVAPRRVGHQPFVSILVPA